MRALLPCALALLCATLGCEKRKSEKGDAMPGAPVFEETLYIGAPAERVWQALVDPEVVNQYQFLPLTEIELKEGGELAYGEGKPPAIACRIVELEPGKKLVHTFAFAHQKDDPPSRVTYEIKAMGEMCELTLTHDRFGGETATYRDVRGGWPVILSSLKTLLETGKALPWPKEDAAESRDNPKPENGTSHQ